MHKAYTKFKAHSLQLTFSVKFALMFLLTIGSAELGMSVGAIVLAQGLRKICSLAVIAGCMGFVSKLCAVATVMLLKQG